MIFLIATMQISMVRETQARRDIQDIRIYTNLKHIGPGIGLINT